MKINEKISQINEKNDIFLYIFFNCKTKIISGVPMLHLTKFIRAIFSQKEDIQFSHFYNCLDRTDYTDRLYLKERTNV